MPEADLAIDKFVGVSSSMERMRARIDQVAGFNYGVLITGPSGTGKELVARAIHQQGRRADKPFIPVNCAAIPRDLFSSQLFGHVKGAFTGATHASIGCFRAADGGTIFLDEIGELDLDCQAKLLRTLQERKVTPVGGLDSVDVDARTIAATNRDLAEEVRQGRFRLDLYYRLNVLSMQTEGLASRLDDIEPLVNHFLAKTAVECGLPLKKISPSGMMLLHSYHWPGNVRELENFIERAVVLTEGPEIGPEAFPEVKEGLVDSRRSAPVPGGYVPPEPTDQNQPLIEPPTPPAPRELSVRQQMGFGSGTTLPSRASVPPPLPPPPPAVAPPEFESTIAPPVEALEEHGQWSTLADVERAHIQRTLKHTFYNQSAAARLLGIDRKLLARRMKKLEITIPKRP